MYKTERERQSMELRLAFSKSRRNGSGGNIFRAPLARVTLYGNRSGIAKRLGAPQVN